MDASILTASSSRVTPEPSEVAFPKTPHDRKTKPTEAQKNTPIARTVNGTNGAFIGQDAASRYNRYAFEANKWTVGPMPCNEFINDFLPAGPPGMPSPKGAFTKVPTDVTAEKKDKELLIYGPLVDDINKNNRCPTIVLVDTSTLSESSGTGSLKPDVCAFDIDELPNIPRSVVKGEDRIPANLGAAELFMEAKLLKFDPYNDPLSNPRSNSAKRREVCLEHHFIDTSYDALKTIGQNVAYAAEAFARQHRLFYFSIMIFGYKARFVRWDRAGAIVSRAFDYKKKPGILCNFLWRFGHASAELRGYDPSVSLASDTEENIFKDTIKQNVIFQLGLNAAKDAQEIDKEMDDHYEPGKVTKLDVYDEKRRTFEQYIVSRPIKSPISLAGRSTRGYWAARLEEGSKATIAFLKDTWRNDVDGLEKEGDIYDELHSNKVPNISEVFCHGDMPDEIEKLREEGGNGNRVTEETSNNITEDPVTPLAKKPLPPAQTTKTDLYVDKDWSCRGRRSKKLEHVYKHTHSRLALKNVGYLLKRFRGSRQLFNAASYIVDTIVEANRHQRLHRDISTGNIILFRGKDGILRAILIDWELSTKTGKDGKARDYFRSGTWAYMSVAALRNSNNFQHSVGDDLESTFYCVLYFAVRALPYTTDQNIGHWMREFFDGHISTDKEGTIVGGTAKNVYLSSPKQFTEEFEFDNGDINQWFNTAYKYLFTTQLELSEYGVKLLWEPMKVQELFSSMRKKNLPECDRVDHEVPSIILDNGIPYQATCISARLHPKDTAEPAIAESSRSRNKRSHVEINEPLDGELRESKKRKGRITTVAKHEAAEGDDQASGENDTRALNLRRSTRSLTRNAGASSVKK